jgi:hypothetical protein
MKTLALATLLAMMTAAGADQGQPGACGGSPVFREPSTPPAQFHAKTQETSGYVVVLTRVPGPAWRVAVYDRADARHQTNLLPPGLPGSRSPGNEHGPLSLAPMYFKEHPNPWILPVTNANARLCVLFSETRIVAKLEKPLPDSDADMRFEGGELIVSWLAGGA